MSSIQVIQTSVTHGLPMALTTLSACRMSAGALGLVAECWIASVASGMLLLTHIRMGTVIATCVAPRCRSYLAARLGHLQCRQAACHVIHGRGGGLQGKQASRVVGQITMAACSGSSSSVQAAAQRASYTHTSSSDRSVTQHTLKLYAR